MTDQLVLKVRRVRPDTDKDVPLPRRMSPASAGLDLHAAVSEPVRIPPGGIAKIPTGITMELPHGHEGQVRPRSGLAAKHGVTLLNSPGTIDQDFRGEVHVILVNLGRDTFTVTRGMRVAQLVIAPVTYCSVSEVTELSETSRGRGGFGSTGE